MIKFICFLLVGFILNACSIGNKIIETDDPYKELKSIQLQQQPSAYPAEKIGRVGGRVSYRLTTQLNSEVKSGKSAEVSIKFQFVTGVRTDELDSVMFFDLDQEKIKLVSAINTITTQTTTVENGTYQLMSRKFVVPENLWSSIVHSKTILYRLYIGREGIDVELTTSEMNKVREFFDLVIRQHDTLLPAIPEGLKKW